MKNVLLHPQTAQLLSTTARHMPQALLITGPTGVGKRFTILSWLQQDVTHIVQIIEPPEKGSISVAQIRELYHATRTKQSKQRFFVIDHAGTMSLGAQNAFLKLLEEPNPSVHFILLAQHAEELLPTIQSRVQHLPIQPLDDEAIKKLLTPHALNASALAQIVFIARGRVGLAKKLAEDPHMREEYQVLASQAKQFLNSSSFERLLLIQPIQMDRNKSLLFLEVVASMARMILKKVTQPSDQQLWVKRLARIHDALEHLSNNGNLKAQLTDLVLHL